MNPERDKVLPAGVGIPSYLSYLPVVAFHAARQESSELRKLTKEPKSTKQCLLPKCTKQTSHNGGYCCAEHCLEHRRILKGAK